jgi:peptide/nickel transport system substrate-binding protein
VLTSTTLLFIGPADKINNDGFFSKPIGSGPFKVASWRPDNELRLEANTDYWGGPPGVQTLTFKEIPEIAARVTALETGEIHFTYSLPPDQLPALRNNNDLKIDSVPSFSYYFVWMNAQRQPFTDKRVRQAMAYALDVDTMIKDLLQGIGKRAQAPIPLGVFGAAPQTPYAYDPAKAKQLLAEAGYPNGFETGMIWNPGGAGPQDRELAQAMISYWNAIGVKVKSIEMERAQWLKDLVALNWDMDFQSNAVLTGDADYTLGRLYVSSANRTGYANPELDKLLTEAASSVDQKKRQDLYAQACKIIWDDAVGIFPVELLENYIYRKTISGFVPDPGQIPTFRTVTIGR